MYFTIDIGITFIRVVFLHVAHFISSYLLWHTHGDRLGKDSTTQCLHDMSNHLWQVYWNHALLVKRQITPMTYQWVSL